MIDLKKKSDCCGCTACASICAKGAIKMKSDEEGFLYPICDISQCNDCHLCEKICPIIYRDNNTYHNRPLKILAVRNKEKEILYHSSSGGAFSALAEEILIKHGIIYGAEYNEKHIVIHSKETTKNGILKFRGSKYVQSNICGIYEEIKSYLHKGELVLFSGTPCQVEGLKCFLRKPYENLITVDILCHGVPSPKIFSDYIKFIKKYSIGHLKNIFMKDKTFGWGYQNVRLYFKEGYTEFNTPLSSLWNKIYYDHICNRPSCHNCKFTNLYRAGDITLGDFWNIEKSHKEFYSSLGVSLLMINTTKGESIWNNIKQNFAYIQSNINECMQPVLQYPQPESIEKEQFWKDYKKYGFEKVIRKRYRITNYKLLKNILQQSINILRRK